MHLKSALIKDHNSTLKKNTKLEARIEACSQGRLEQSSCTAIFIHVYMCLLPATCTYMYARRRGKVSLHTCVNMYKCTRKFYKEHIRRIFRIIGTPYRSSKRLSGVHPAFGQTTGAHSRGVGGAFGRTSGLRAINSGTPQRCSVKLSGIHTTFA